MEFFWGEQTAFFDVTKGSNIICTNSSAAVWFITIHRSQQAGIYYLFLDCYMSKVVQRGMSDAKQTSKVRQNILYIAPFE